MRQRSKISSAELLKLTPTERIRLMQEIWDTLDEPDGLFELTDDQKRELDRRWRGYKRNPKRARTWEEAKAELLRAKRRTG